MRFIFLLQFAAFTLGTIAVAQQKYEWKVLANSPIQSGRYEDISFINANQGWAVAGTSALIRTANGG